MITKMIQFKIIFRQLFSDISAGTRGIRTLLDYVHSEILHPTLTFRRHCEASFSANECTCLPSDKPRCN